MSTALYRRYRPDTFDDVIGQEHVTEPLVAALNSGRINHAYLFSGPRGCGKTTSARIFARCLNCADGPTGTPCGVCDSCVELATGGPGSLDVVEMDAASHGGVDDARDLRERAVFAPVRDRYKVFIIDEAHMVTPQGFNALLKLVEEPPEHVKFIFATTEPEKVIGTIRSRTHHYPFRLVPPERLQSYLGQLAEAEGIEVESGVLPLVVRAGGGSVRDSLSVLDQLIAGSDGEQITYERSVALLGFTHATLLDDAVDALAARDGASLFRVVERVISSGHAPRRFVEDLLERLRDLIVVLAAGDNAAAVLPTVSPDQLERMHSQAQHLGAATASRAADLVNDTLSEMAGATSPRLQLELLCARLLLPGADPGTEGYGARLDRLEQEVAQGVPAGRGASAGMSAPAGAAAQGVPSQAPDAGAPAPQSAPAPAAAGGRAGAPGPASEAGPVPAGPVPAGPAAAGSGPGGPATGTSEPPAPTEPQGPPPAEPVVESAPEPSHQPAQQRSQQAERPPQPPSQDRPDPAQALSGPPPAEPPPGPAGVSVDLVRRRWPEVLETLARLKRGTWTLVSQEAQVLDLSDGVLTLGFATEGLATAFRTGAHHGEALQRAFSETIGLEVRLKADLATAVPGARGGNAGAQPGTSASGSAPHHGAGPEPARPARRSTSEAARRAEEEWGMAPGAQRAREGRPGPAAHESDPDDSQEGDPAGAPPAALAAVPTTPAVSPPSAAGTEPADPASPSPAAPASTGPASSGPAPAPAAAPRRPAEDTPPWEEDDIPPAEPPWDEDVEPEPPAPSAEAPPSGADTHDPDLPDMSDPSLEDSQLVGPPLVAKMLGGVVIDEIVEPDERRL